MHTIVKVVSKDEYSPNWYSVGDIFRVFDDIDIHNINNKWIEVYTVVGSTRQVHVRDVEVVKKRG